MGKLTKPMRKRRNYARDYCRDVSLRKSKCPKESSNTGDGKRVFDKATQRSEEAIDEST